MIENLSHTVAIVASYVGHHNIAADNLPELIRSVHRTLAMLGEPEPESLADLVPAVPIKRSVTPDAVVCLECGFRARMLKRHLRTGHALSPEQYRQRWTLPYDHPLIAPSYTAQRSAMAKELGLGRGNAGLLRKGAGAGA